MELLPNLGYLKGNNNTQIFYKHWNFQIMVHQVEAPRRQRAEA